MPLILQDEIYKIARKMMRNAFIHADANHIEAEIRYDKDQLRLRIRDDGTGIDPKTFEAGGRPDMGASQGYTSEQRKSGRN